MVVELKVGKFRHEFAGQAFYVTMVDDQLRHRTGTRPPFGMLLCSSSTDGVVRYALRSANAAMAVATYAYDALPAAGAGSAPACKGDHRGVQWRRRADRTGRSDRRRRR